MRFVYDDYTSTFESLLEKDKSVSIHHRNIHRVAIEMYKVINNLSPGIIQDLFQKRDISTLRIQTNTFIRPSRMFRRAHLVFAHILTCADIQDGSLLSNAVSNEAYFLTAFSSNAYNVCHPGYEKFIPGAL